MKDRIIKVGCCGFPVKRSEYFNKFSVAELQSTFYQLPVKITTVKRWREEAPERAEFVIKAWQLITHPPSSPTYKKLKIKLSEKKENYGFFKPTEEVFEAWRKTREVAKVLRAKIILFQCPSSFKPKKENIDNMKVFFREIKEKDFFFVWSQGENGRIV